MLNAFLPLMVETAAVNGTVDVVNVTAIGAHMTIYGASAYQASKFALLRLSEFVETEHAAKCINCFSVHPGGVLTELTKGVEAIRPSKFIVHSCVVVHF